MAHPPFLLVWRWSSCSDLEKPHSLYADYLSSAAERASRRLSLVLSMIGMPEIEEMVIPERVLRDGVGGTEQK